MMFWKITTIVFVLVGLSIGFESCQKAPTPCKNCKQCPGPRGYCFGDKVPSNFTCCGCFVTDHEGGHNCTACPLASSCPAWSPTSIHGTGYCPVPSENNAMNVFDECIWKKTLTLRSPQYAVFRCTDIPYKTPLAITWALQDPTGKSKVMILSQFDFYDWIAGKKFGCINDCSSTTGELYFGSRFVTEFYIVTLGLDQASTHRYPISASITENL